ncbi:MAG: carbohydrate ABC transporter permease [Clostridiales bacterium]|jgi:multiple sugar transport system permease protein|nr:carbohydrate ABC transporter permease [Clostridiales bacterium]
MKIFKKTLIYALMIALALVFLVPLGYAVITSLVPFEYVNKIPPLEVLSLRNYIKIFEQYPIMDWFKNSIIVAVFTLAGNLVTSLLAGYALAKFKFRGREAVFNLILVQLMIPFQVLLTPLYIMVAGLGWHSTNIGLIVPFLVSGLSIFMARQFYKTIPDELIEAARVDGLGYIRSFFHISLPLSGPLVVTLAILDFTSCWNAYLVPSTFLAKNTAFTLPVGLATIKAANFIRPNETMAGVLILSLPVIIVFLILQRQFIEGIATSGLKG